MRLARGHYASLDPQLLGLKSNSTTEPLRPALLNLLINPVMSYGIASYFPFAACFFFFFFFFLQQIMLTLPRVVAHLSRVIRLWHECNEPE